MKAASPGLFTRLAPVLNVSDLAAERAFYESLGLPMIYEGDEYPDFIAFGTDAVHFGIQPAAQENDPPSVLTWQITVSSVDEAAERCRAAGRPAGLHARARLTCLRPSRQAWATTAALARNGVPAAGARAGLTSRRLAGRVWCHMSSNTKRKGAGSDRS